MRDEIDPTNATSPTFNRRAFARLSAGIAAAATTPATAALAQTGSGSGSGTGFGAPHAPIVAEDDPAIATGRPQIRYGTRTIDSYIASPKNAGPTTPGVVVAQAIWGVDAQLRDVVRRLAKAGYIAIAPDLYTGLGAPSGDGATDFSPFRVFAGKLADDQVDADIAAAANFIRSGAGGKAEKLGVIGFCMGAVYYGKVRYGTTNDNGTITPIALTYADDIGMPLCGSWGQRDTSIVADDVRALDARLTQLNRPHDMKVYDEAGHAFFDDTRSSYVATAATDAWARTLAYFARHLNA
jgi:carboxymethylenebutenolidase